MAQVPNSTITSWAPEPEGRGTIGLLWSCLATIFICCWSAVHPNIASEGDSEAALLRRRIVYFLTCLCAPEFFAINAFSELRLARELKAKSPGWGLRTCYFVQMGGIVVQDESPDPAKRRTRYNPNEYISHLVSNQLPWPEINKHDIDDRSKADWIVKMLALVQITWFLTQIIGRLAQGLAITTLELFTLGVVLCGTAMYIAFWKKPFDVHRPMVVHVNGCAPAREMPFKRVSLGTPEPFMDMRNAPWISAFSFLICLGFGALHIAAWNFHFPTAAELLLWRISSIACLVLPVALGFWTDFGDRFGWSTWMSVAQAGILGLYGLSRIYMFVDMFVGLRAIPASVYQTPQWSQYFPAFN